MMVCLPCLRRDPLSPTWAQTKHALVCTFGGPVCPTGSPAVSLLAVSEKDAGEELLGANRTSSQNGGKPSSGSLRHEISLRLVMIPILVPLLFQIMLSC